LQIKKCIIAKDFTKIVIDFEDVSKKVVYKKVVLPFLLVLVINIMQCIFGLWCIKIELFHVTDIFA